MLEFFHHVETSARASHPILSILQQPRNPSLILSIATKSPRQYRAYTIDEALKFNIEDNEESLPPRPNRGADYRRQRHTTCRVLHQGRRWLARMQCGSCTHHRDPRQ